MITHAANTAWGSFMGRHRLVTNKGIARKAYIIITLVITLPLCAAFYYFSEQQKKIILMGTEQELTRMSSLLAQQLPHSGKAFAYWGGGLVKGQTDEENLREISDFYQPYVDRMADTHPQCRIGIYHRKLDRVIALHPYVNPASFIPFSNSAVKSVLSTGEPVTLTVATSRMDGMPAFVSISPIFHLGEVVGYTWVSKKIDHILAESNELLIKGLLFSLILWLMLMLIVRSVFQRLDRSLIQFSDQIANAENSGNQFQDFPQLEPLFATVVSLRQNLGRESQHYLEENQKLKKLIELTPLAITVIDSKGILRDCNKAFLEQHPNFTQESVIGMPYKTLAESAGLDYESAVIIRALEGQEIRDHYGASLTNCWISNAFPLKNNIGEIIGAMEICHDITQYEKIRKDIVRLDRLNIVGQMAASVAHEVRNPMTVVRGFTQSLLMKTGDTYRAQFEMIISELDRANKIVNDFLSLARGKYVEKRRQSLSAIIQEIYPLIENEALARSISPTLQIADSLPESLVNPEEMKQLLLNLSMNALDAMNAAGELAIGCSHDQKANEIVMTVRDTGCGISQADYDQIFEPFYTTKKHGSGLGLAVCKSIIERHGGNMSIQSEIQRGTTFSVRFPITA